MSAYVSTPPPVGSPTMIARVSRSISAAKFAAAENVARPTSRNSSPRLSTAGEPRSDVSAPYVVLSPPPLSRTSTMTRRMLGARDESLDLPQDRRRRRAHGVVAHVDGAPARESPCPERLRATRQVERSRAVRERRRVVAVDAARRTRRRTAALVSAVSWTSARWPSGRSNVNVGGPGSVDDAEAVEHLGGEQEVRRQPAQVRRVVARRQRLDELEDALDRRCPRSRRDGSGRATSSRASTT